MFEDLIASIPSSLKRKAEKCAVRECDETEKGTFIAYVDEGDETFDVSLTFKKDTLIASTCDCKKSKMCEHKAALLLFISNPQVKKPNSVKTKKQDPLLALLNDTDSDVLKQWFGQLMLNNKDIRLAFELQFAQAASLSIEEIGERTRAALKTVVKNKKNVDVNQLKKIIDLWMKIHEPVVSEYYQAVFNKESFERFHHALKTCSLEQERITTLSNKIPMYISDLVMRALEHIHQLQQEEQWQQAISLIFDGMKSSTHFLKMSYLELLKNLYQVSHKERKEILIRQLMGRYHEIESIHPYYKKEVGEFFLTMVRENNLTKEYSGLFQSIDFAYSYNMLLVDMLLELKEYGRAEKICINEIKFHAKNAERPAYYRKLISIYTALNEEKKLTETMKRIFPYTFEFEDYKFVYDRLKTSTNKADWRLNALKMAQDTSKQLYPQSMDFRLRLALEENDLTRALHLVENGCPYSIILRHNSTLTKQFKESFLFSMFNRYDDNYYISTNKQYENEMEALAELINLLLHHFGPEQIQKMILKMKEKRKILKSEFALSMNALVS